MSRFDHYRKQAQEAQERADQAKHQGDKAAWLKIAQCWLDMLPKSKLRAEELFDAQSKARGTGQEDSGGLH